MTFHYLDLFDCGLFNAEPVGETGRDTNKVLDAVRMTLLRNVLMDTVTIIPAQWACTSYAFFTAIPESTAPFQEVVTEYSRLQLLSRVPVKPVRIASSAPEEGWLEDARKRYLNPGTPLFGLPGGDPRLASYSERARTQLGQTLAKCVEDVQRGATPFDITDRLSDQIEDRILAQGIIDVMELTKGDWNSPFNDESYLPTYAALVSTVSELIASDTLVRRTGDPLIGTYETFFKVLRQRPSFKIPDLFEIARDFSPREEASILNVGRALLAYTLRGCMSADQMSYSGAMLNQDTNGFDSQLVRRTIRLQEARLRPKSDRVRHTASTSGLPSHVWRALWKEVWRFKLGPEHAAFVKDIQMAKSASNEITRGKHLQRAIERVIDAMPSINLNLIDSDTGLLGIKLSSDAVARLKAASSTASTVGSGLAAITPTISSVLSSGGAWGSLLAMGHNALSRRRDTAGLKHIIRFA